ncbi:PrsW family intramembrane metalloprotease [Aeromicrobium chenweiae]|uniref:PrsW family intramembrane metalloprotease n=1 Tax=Aeromicrobium chenweiae TaxID=2079793 RepID=A0A2S0WJX5_9ACTN|nr:PrsW family intramembrane metalloprotease [Aeromicrobium chenweiae]AWB91646.1 PrsW family intramembrane metalloprotease [Aeromicrobium chenweiae]TGN32486.1 PrsW family intramembrane metalloprotease [Aeromicrobium chenweiae]
MTDVTASPFPSRLPRYREPVRQRGRTALIVLFVAIAIAGVVGGVALSLSAGDSEGTGLSLFYAMIPLPLLWLVYWWLDRYEPEPRRYKFAGFVWGGVVAVAIALALEVWLQKAFDLSDDVTASVVAPLVEEPAKCLFLLLTFVRARRVIDGVLDGLVYAGIVGIGFAFIENIGYYASSYTGSADYQLAGADGATSTFVVRGLFSPLAHPLFTSAFGIAIGLAVSQKSKIARVLTAILGLAVSVGLHALWNGSLSYDDTGVAFVLAYLSLGVLLLGIAILAIVVRVRQVRILERSLSYVAQRGWIHPAEIPYLSRFSYRKAARRYAKQNYGKVAADAVARYQRLAGEMAFLHDALMKGRTKPDGVERTYALLDEMYALRPLLRFPPALRSIARPF